MSCSRLANRVYITSLLFARYRKIPGLADILLLDSQLARDAFSIFIPISVDNDSARTQIIFDFFDLLTAIAAHGKSNGLGGRKLSRYAGWWAFEHSDTGNGFEAAYKNWAAYVSPFQRFAFNAN